jgi:hypothetical protein
VEVGGVMSRPREFDFRHCDDPPSVFERDAVMHLRRACREQGLLIVITDRAVIERIATMLRGGS